MTYFKLKVLHFTFFFVYAFLIIKILGILIAGESLWTFSFMGNFLFPLILIFVIEFVNGFLNEKSYQLELGQSALIIKKLYALGYLPTLDEGPVYFYKKRKIFGWKTARLEEGINYLSLFIMEKIPDFE